MTWLLNNSPLAEDAIRRVPLRQEWPGSGCAWPSVGSSPGKYGLGASVVVGALGGLGCQSTLTPQQIPPKEKEAVIFTATIGPDHPFSHPLFCSPTVILPAESTGSRTHLGREEHSNSKSGFDY